MSTYRSLALAAVVSLSAGFAQAATLDFAAEGAADERAVADGTSFTFDDVTVSVTAEGGLPYLDGPSGGRPGGLGDCSTEGVVAGGDCPVASDDNVTIDEAVTLTFGTTVNLSDLVFRGEKHYLVDEADPAELDFFDTLLITTDLASETMYTFGDAQNTSFLGISWITLSYGGESADQFYLSSAEANIVPVPAGLPLLLGGLGALGFLRRRQSR